MRGDDTKPKGTDVKIFVVGDRSRDAVVLDLPRRSNAGRHAHYANHQYYVLPGGIDHLALMIEGAIQKRLTTKVDLTFDLTERELPIDLDGEVLEVRAWLGDELLDKAKIDKKYSRFDATLGTLKERGDIKISIDGIGDGADMGVRPNVVKRAWEFIKAEVHIEYREGNQSWRDLLNKLGVELEIPGNTDRIRLTLNCGKAEIHVARGIGVNVKVSVKDRGAPDGEMLVPSLTLNESYPTREFIAELAKYPQTRNSRVPERLDVPVYRRSRMLGQRDELSTTGFVKQDHREVAMADSIEQINGGHLPSNPCICCINDDGLGFTEQREAKAWLGKFKESSQKLFWIIKAGRFASFRDKFYTKYLREVPGAMGRAIAITSADALRAGSGAQAIDRGPNDSDNAKDRDGVRLSQDVSWELLIDDVLEAIGGGALNRRMGVPNVLIIMFGMAGAAVVRDSLEGNGAKAVDFVFDPRSTEHDYAPELKFGGVGGVMSVFAAKVASELKVWLQSEGVLDTDSSLDKFVKPSQGEASKLVTVCEEALRASRRCFDYGYGPSERTVKRCRDWDFPTTQIFHDPNRQKPQDSFAVVSFDCPAAPTGNWSLLGRAIGEDERKAFGLASEIVQDGLGVLRRAGSVPMPILRVGKLTTVDRREIEGLRTLESVFRRYLSSSDTRPASVAVFGAPGSGKSRSVKELVQVLSADQSGNESHPRLREMEFNMTQFATAEELASAVLDLSNACVGGEIPVAFFDEFDVQDGEVYRWISKFLPLMEDGFVTLRGRRVRIGKSILVFAGGVHTSYGKLACVNAQKVPDFVSRLSGYLDVAGPNPRDAADSGEKMQSWIRRAVQIRTRLEEVWVSARQAAHSVDSDALDVEPRVLRALIQVDEYINGSRSIRSLLNGCKFGNASAFTVSMLPPRSLIEMDVRNNFFDLLGKDPV